MQKDLPYVDTTGWRTSRFERYGIELKTPYGWGIFEMEDSTFAKKGFANGYICIVDTKKVASFKGRSDAKDCMFTIEDDISLMCDTPGCNFNDKQRFFRALDSRISHDINEHDEKGYMYWSQLNEDIILVYSPTYAIPTVINFKTGQVMRLYWSNRSCYQPDFTNNVNNDLGVFQGMLQSIRALD